MENILKITNNIASLARCNDKIKNIEVIKDECLNGFYIAYTKTIGLNIELINSILEFMSNGIITPKFKEAMHTIMHECRHAWQKEYGLYKGCTYRSSDNYFEFLVESTPEGREYKRFLNAENTLRNSMIEFYHTNITYAKACHARKAWVENKAIKLKDDLKNLAYECYASQPQEIDADLWADRKMEELDKLLPLIFDKEVMELAKEL